VAAAELEDDLNVVVRARAASEKTLAGADEIIRGLPNRQQAAPRDDLGMRIEPRVACGQKDEVDVVPFENPTTVTWSGGTPATRISRTWSTTLSAYNIPSVPAGRASEITIKPRSAKVARISSYS